MTGIYKITSPKGKVYIGQSRNITRRFSSYRNLECQAQIRLYNSFIKYGVENHVFDILEICPANELNEKEIYWIGITKCTGRIGLNCREGGASGSFSKKSRDKMSKSATGRISSRKGTTCSNETKLKMSLSRLGKEPWNKGKKLPASQVEKMIASRTGCKHTEETKLKMSIARKGKVNLRKVIDEKTGEIFESVGLASIYANLKYTTLLEMLKGRNKNKTNLKYYKP